MIEQMIFDIIRRVVREELANMTEKQSTINEDYRQAFIGLNLRVQELETEPVSTVDMEAVRDAARCAADDWMSNNFEIDNYRNNIERFADARIEQYMDYSFSISNYESAIRDIIEDNLDVEAAVEEAISNLTFEVTVS